jgi:hypothetical protein
MVPASVRLIYVLPIRAKEKLDEVV